MFRGVAFEKLRRRWGRRPALGVTAIAFGVLHLDPVGAALSGWALGIMLCRSGSLGACVVGHAMYNAILMAASLGGSAVEHATLIAYLTVHWPTGLSILVGGVALLAVWYRNQPPLHERYRDVACPAAPSLGS